MKDIIMFFTGIKDENLLEKLSSVSHIKKLHRKEVLYEAGQPLNELYILVEGVLRVFSLGRDGEDKTTCFIVNKGSLTASNTDLTGNTKSRTFAEALTETKVLAIPTKVIMDLCMENREMLEYIVESLGRFSEALWSMNHILTHTSSKELVLWFIHRFPGVIRTATNAQVADFLGMSPVHFSRVIRALKAEGEEI